MVNDFLDGSLAEQVIGEAAGAFDAEDAINAGSAEVEVGEQDALAGQLSLRHGEIAGSERLSFAGRGAADDQRVQRLRILKVIETGAETAELLRGRVFGLGGIHQ